VEYLQPKLVAVMNPSPPPTPKPAGGKGAVSVAAAAAKEAAREAAADASAAMKTGRIERGGRGIVAVSHSADGGGVDGGGQGGKKRGRLVLDVDEEEELSVGGWRIAQVGLDGVLMGS